MQVLDRVVSFLDSYWPRMSRLATMFMAAVVATSMIFWFSTVTKAEGDGVLDTYTNPVGDIAQIGDPFVMKHEGEYYLYATSLSSRGFYVWHSLDLINWDLKGKALDCLWEGNWWGGQDFWAPEVIYYEGRFYMTYSARDGDDHLKIALAASDDPLGPFINVKAPYFDRGASFIDAHIFVDDDGTPYMFYVKDCSENVIDGKHVSQIYVQQMSEDLLELQGEPILAVEPSEPWEFRSGDWLWNEGPFALKHDGVYYLMYSANFYGSSDYAIGYATALSPLGPWIKYEGNPILAKDLDIGVSGPGHNSVTRSPDGTELLVVYHTHTYPEHPSGNRTVNIDRLCLEDGILKVKGPTRSPQPAPSK